MNFFQKQASALGRSIRNKAASLVGKKIQKAVLRVVLAIVKKFLLWFISIVGPYAFVLILTLILAGGFLLLFTTPNMSKETVQKYVTVAQELGIDWRELIAFDMARYDNEDMDSHDPNDAALYFLTLTEERYKTEKVCIPSEDGEDPCERIMIQKIDLGTATYKGARRLKKVLGSDAAKGLKAAIDRANAEDGRTITYINHGLEEAMTIAGFSGDQKEYVRTILESGTLDSDYPEFSYADDGSFIPGMCTGPISTNGKARGITAAVQGYDATLREVAKKYGMEAYVEIIKAKMMQESGGRGSDPMQASESPYATRVSAACVGKSGSARVGCITDPRASIEAGIQTFRDVLKSAGGDLALALQSYNFGSGYIGFAKARGGHSQAVAQEFSNMMKAKLGWNVYGDPQYIPHIMRYYADAGCVATATGQGATVASSMGWGWPTVSNRVTDVFTSRRGNRQHNALDIGAVKPGVAGDQIFAIADGKVLRSDTITGGGHAVYIDHGNGYVSRYIHMKSRSVKTGDVVKKGTVVGYMGGTSASGPGQPAYNGYPVHLDFQIQYNGSPVDPAKFYSIPAGWYNL